MILRTGRSVGRTIYRQVGDEPSKDDVLIGVMDTPELAAMVVAAVAHTEATVARDDLQASMDTESPQWMNMDDPRIDRQVAEFMAFGKAMKAARDAFRAAREAIR